MKMKDTRLILLTFSAAAGIVFMAFYIVAVYRLGMELVPQPIFWFGAILLSSSLFCLWKFGNNMSHLLLIILVSAFFIASMSFLRFDFYGADLVEELYVAQTTKNLGAWPIDHFAPYTVTSYQPIPTQINHQYFSSLSVTILPAIISSVSGLSMVDVFRLIVPLASVLALLGAFLVIRKTSGQRIAALSVIVFALHFIFGVYTDLLREDVALIFFFLAWYLVLKQDGKPSLRWRALSAFLIFSIPFAHYTVMYFLMAWAVFLFASESIYNYVRSRASPFSRSRMPLDIQHQLMPKEFVFYTVFASIAWLFFVVPTMFSSNILSNLKVFEALSGIGLSQYSHQVAHVFSSSLGPFHTYVKLGIMGLTIIGFLVSFKEFRKRKSAALFTLWGGALLILAFLWIIIPDVSAILNPDRVYALGLICFSTFIAVSLDKLARKLRVIGIVLSMIFVTAIFLDAVALPIYYVPASQLSPQTRSIFAPEYQIIDVSSATWIQTNVEANNLIASDKIGCRLIVAFGQHIASMPYVNSTDISVLAKAVGANYFFMIGSNQGFFVLLPAQYFFVNQKQTNRLNQIYSNGKDSLFQIP